MSERRLSVSILLSNYNHAQYLPECLDAIVDQTRPADSIIIVDDGSTDDSLKIIEAYAVRYPSVRVLRNSANRGLLYSIARALESATSDCIYWAAADDRIHASFIDKTMAALERHPQAALCFSETTVLDAKTGAITPFAAEPSVRHIFDLGDLPEYLSPDELVTRLRRTYLSISTNTVIFRRERLAVMGGFPAVLAWHADWLVAYALALTHGVCVVPETLALSRVVENSFSDSGRRDRERARTVYAEILTALRRPPLRHVRRYFRRCPVLFSPFGREMLLLLIQRPQDWDMVIPFLLWNLREFGRGRGLNRWQVACAALRWAWHRGWTVALRRPMPNDVPPPLP